MRIVKKFIVLEVPTGTILLYSGSASGLMGVDNQWLFCNGSAVSRSTYSSLFRVIGTIYGSGDGIDTFNLPDFRARFPLGSLVPNDITLVSGGAASHILAIAELPAHDHSQGSLQTVADGVHTHSYTDPGHNHGGSTGSGPFAHGTSSMIGGSGNGNDAGSHTHSIAADTTGITIQSSGNHTHTITGSTDSTGQGQPIDMMPPYQTIHYIIRI
jgi:microcystin-dependent protein